MSHLPINTRQSCHDFLVRKLSTIGGGFVCWPIVTARLKRFTVSSGCDGGRYIIVSVNGFNFRISDAAHNCYLITSIEA